jgi:hypothetical protein
VTLESSLGRELLRPLAFRKAQRGADLDLAEAEQLVRRSCLSSWISLLPQTAGDFLARARGLSSATVHLCTPLAFVRSIPVSLSGASCRCGLRCLWSAVEPCGIHLQPRVQRTTKQTLCAYFRGLVALIARPHSDEHTDKAGTVCWVLAG